MKWFKAVFSASLVLLLFLAAILVNSLQSYFVTVSNVGSVKVKALGGIKIYDTRKCTQELTSLEWGVLEPNWTEKRAGWIRNEAEHIITMTMWTDNWNPLNASDYMTLSWDREFLGIKPMQVVQSIFTLFIHPDIGGIYDFSFDIVIYGEQT